MFRVFCFTARAARESRAGSSPGATIDEAVPAFLASWDARQGAAVCAVTAPAAVTKDAVWIGSPWLSLHVSKMTYLEGE